MRKIILTGIVAAVSAICILTAQDEPMPYAPGAFGVWGWDWPTTGGDAQRTSSVRNDRWISRATVTKPGLRLQYKIALSNTSRPMYSLSQPVLVQTARGLTGFKSMGFVAGSGGMAFGFDYDTSQVLWKTPLGPAPQGTGTPACPGGLTSLARPTPLVIANVTDTEAGRGVAPENLPGARKSGTAVGTPGGGAPIVGALERAKGAPAASGRGGGGGGGRGSSGIYALATDGVLHQLSMQQGFDVSMQPAAFLPPNANASGLIIVDNVAYAATSNNCGGIPNGIYALDLASPAKTVSAWKGDVVGFAFGTDGTVYAAAADGIYSIEPKTLKQRGDAFKPGTGFNSSPVVFQHKGKDAVAASGRDGKLYLLDGTSSGKLAYAPAGLATWAESTGTRWILASTSNAVTAFKMTDQGLTQAWTSRAVARPPAPLVVNGVSFVLSSQPAVLYALDAITGKELWNSGKTITSSAAVSAGLAMSTGQVYVETSDNNIYAFGMEPKEN